jgi:hypothetical protein
MARFRAAISRHPVVFGLGVLVVGFVAVFGLVYFEPQKLFLDDRVDEALPGTAAQPDPADGSDDEPMDAGEVPTLLEGEFRPLDHSVSGRARILEVEDGSLFLRFDDFEVQNGPDLKVYLSSAPSDSQDDAAFARDFVDLGTLKGNIGNQNYELPNDVDLEKYRSVVVWCRRFSVGFAVAGLS